MKKDWTNQDIARMNYLIDKYGKKDGITLFSKESNRTTNSIRIKLARLNKEIIVQNAEDKAYEELNANKKDNAEEHLSWFQKIINAFYNIL